MGSVEFTLEDYDHFREVVGSLMISQFDGDQGQYRSVINTLFVEFAKPSDGETE